MIIKNLAQGEATRKEVKFLYYSNIELYYFLRNYLLLILNVEIVLYCSVTYATLYILSVKTFLFTCCLYKK